MQSVASTYINNALFFFKQSYQIATRNNSLGEIVNNITASVNNILTANRRLQIARYRVSRIKYRVFQMEKIIEDNNPNNHQSGTRFNHIR